MGRDELDGSIKEEKNLKGKIQYMEMELQVLEYKYLLSGRKVYCRQCFFASELMPASFQLHA